MENLGFVNGELIHRYFGEDSFKDLREKKSFSDVVVITYVDVKAAKSNLEYILKQFDGKTGDLTILLGVSWFKKKDNKSNTYKIEPYSISKYTKLIEYISTLAISKEYEFSKLNVHFNTRCHIKALYADEITYIGSQNVASTSEPFSENKHFENLFNNHELLVRLDDPSGQKAKALLTEILKDDIHSNTVISDGIFIGAPTLEELDQNKSVNHIETVHDLITSIKAGVEEIRDTIEQSHESTSLF